MQRFEGKDLITLGLNKEEDRDKEAAVARELELGYPVLLGMQDAFESYWVDGIPDTVLIDRNGILRGRWTGFSDGLQEELGATIERALRDEW